MTTDTDSYRRGRRLARVGGAAVALGFLACILLLGVAVAAAQGTGEPAPDVTLRTANGEWRLSQERGKVVVLFFSFPG